MTDPTPRLRSVAVPTEHGGWSLTLEPAALGLIVAPSLAGFALAAVALLGFVFRTPARIVLIDRFRSRRLERTALAERVAGVELVTIGGLIVLAAATARAAWWPPLVPAAGLLAVATWYDARSKSRRLIPELASTIGVSGIATAIALAGEIDGATAYGLWVVAGSRALAAVVFVRLQLRRAKGQVHSRATTDAAQVVAALVVGAGGIAGWVPLAGVAAVCGLGIVHIFLARRPAPRAAVVGSQQVVFGLTVVLVTGLAVIAP